MNDLLLQFGVSNLIVSLLLALSAYLVQTKTKRPVIAHLLWLLVLVKLITPPLFNLNLIEWTATPSAELLPFVGAGAVSMAPSIETGIDWAAESKFFLLMLWSVGSAIVLCISLARVVRFDRLMQRASKPAGEELQFIARQLAGKLGLQKIPTVYTSSANISPMVWWVGGRVRLLIPEQLQRDMDKSELRWVLAHELAHVKRRDHMVRWLEWLACVAFWWNPIAWVARRNLRINEEVCCDALVLRSMQVSPRTYATSLLSVLEFLSAAPSGSQAYHPPALSSAIDSGGFLEARIRMIISNNKLPATPRWLSVALMTTAMLVLPLGVASAQDPESKITKKEIAREQAQEKKQATARKLEKQTYEIRQAIEAGEITPEEGKAKMQELRRRTEVSSVGKFTPRVRRVNVEELRAAEAKIAQAIENGDITPAEGRKKLDAMRGPAAGVGVSSFSKQEYAEALRKIEMGIRSGQISVEDGKRRIEEMQSRMQDKPGGSIRRVKAGPKDQEMRRELEEIQAKLMREVEAGRITEVQAKERMGEVRKKMGKVRRK